MYNDQEEAYKAKEIDVEKILGIKIRDKENKNENIFTGFSVDRFLYENLTKRGRVNYLPIKRSTQLKLLY